MIGHIMILEALIWADFLLAAEELTKKGYYVIRTGQKLKSKLIHKN